MATLTDQQKEKLREQLHIVNNIIGQVKKEFELLAKDDIDCSKIENRQNFDLDEYLGKEEERIENYITRTRALLDQIKPFFVNIFVETMVAILRMDDKPGLSGNKDKGISSGTPRIVVFTCELIKLYQLFSPFPDAEILQIFRRLRFKETDLIWFIDCRDTLLEIRKINDRSKMIVWPRLFFVQIIRYMDIRIYKQVCDLMNLSDYVSPAEPGMISEMERFIERRKYAVKNKKHDKFLLFDELMGQLIAPYEPFLHMEGIKNADRFFLNLFKGDIKEVAIIPIYEKAFKIGEISQSESFRLFFNLFRLVLKDHKFYSEDEYDAAESPPCRSYKIYQAWKMKKFITKK